jgi:ribulose-5-phosphate 4-epimerase/fuculose-1-phosphate aldolase
MAEKEGVIKYHLDHTPADPLPTAELAELNHWRKWMHNLKLIGVVEMPIGLIGYGNISQRFGEGFIISGSQTGHLADLTSQHYTLITEAYPLENRLVSQGPIPPSSESLTHAVVYQEEPAIQFVFHAHHVPLWHAAERLGLPQTSAEAAYGTPEMAAETARLFRETDVREWGIFSMAGHEDGIISFGGTAEKAAAALEKYLKLAGDENA